MAYVFAPPDSLEVQYVITDGSVKPARCNGRLTHIGLEYETETENITVFFFRKYQNSIIFLIFPKIVD